MKSLAEIYEKYKSPQCYGDKGTVHSYISVYEQLLAPYRQTSNCVLEIGILSGDSLRMWEEYFSTSTVYGIDLCETPLDMCDLRPMIAEGSHRILLFDGSDKQQVDKHFNGTLFDAVVEDASHSTSQQLAMYKNFKPYMKPDGIYIIEDVENIDRDLHLFEAIDPDKPVRILDRRSVKNRFDDVMVVIGGTR